MTVPVRFHDIHELLDACDRDPARQSHAVGAKARGFTATENFKEAERLLLEGWEEGEKLFRPFHIEISTEESGWSLSYDVCGESVDVDRFVQGEPECMWQFTQAPLPKRAVTIGVSVAASASVSLDVIHQRGALACSLVEACEQAGLRVELWVDCSGLYNRESVVPDFSFQTCIKAENEFLNKKRAAFCLAHPSFLRRIMFAVYEKAQITDHSPYYALPASCPENFDYFIENIRQEQDFEEWLKDVRQLLMGKS